MENSVSPFSDSDSDSDSIREFSNRPTNSDSNARKGNLTGSKNTTNSDSNDRKVNTLLAALSSSTESERRDGAKDLRHLTELLPELILTPSSLEVIKEALYGDDLDREFQFDLTLLLHKFSPSEDTKKMLEKCEKREHVVNAVNSLALSETCRRRMLEKVAESLQKEEVSIKQAKVDGIHLLLIQLLKNESKSLVELLKILGKLVSLPEVVEELNNEVGGAYMNRLLDEIL